MKEVGEGPVEVAIQIGWNNNIVTIKYSTPKLPNINTMHMSHQKKLIQEHKMPKINISLILLEPFRLGF
jgi:hypothetical protein